MSVQGSCREVSQIINKAELDLFAMAMRRRGKVNASARSRVVKAHPHLLQTLGSRHRGNICEMDVTLYGVVKNP